MGGKRTAESEVVSRDGGFYRTWIVRPLAVVLVAFSVLVGACDQDQEAQPEEAQPAEAQPAEEDPEGNKVPQEEEGESD